MLSGVAAGLTAGALWGLVFVAPRLAPGLSPIDFTSGRFLSYGAVSLLLLCARKSPWPDRTQGLAALGMSVLGFTGYYLLLVLAVRDVGVVLPSLIIGTIPLWMMLLGRPAGLRLSALVPAMVLTLLGLALMVGAATDGGVDVLDAPHFLRGMGFALASMVCWTAFGLINAAWLKKYPQVTATAWANWLGLATGAQVLGLWLIAGTDINVLLTQESRLQAAMVCIATGVGSAWLATVLWNLASQRLSASLCGQLIVSETVFALFYAFLVDGRWPTLPQVVAEIFFVSGVVVAVRVHR